MASGKKKIIFDVEDDLWARQRGIPWGVKTKVLAKVLERLLDSVDEHGAAVYGFILDGKFDIVPEGLERDK